MSEKKTSEPNSISEFKDTSRKYILRKREEMESNRELLEFFALKEWEKDSFVPPSQDILTNKHGD